MSKGFGIMTVRPLSALTSRRTCLARALRLMVYETVRPSRVIVRFPTTRRRSPLDLRN
jgi:hypothetical protein